MSALRNRQRPSWRDTRTRSVDYGGRLMAGNWYQGGMTTLRSYGSQVVRGEAGLGLGPKMLQGEMSEAEGKAEGMQGTRGGGLLSLMVHSG